MDLRETEILIFADAPAALVELCGISMLERMLRTLQRIGICEVTVISATPERIRAHLALPSWARANFAAVVHEQRSDTAYVPVRERVLILSGSTLFDARLVSSLLIASRPSLLIDSAPPRELFPLLAAKPQNAVAWSCGAILTDRRWWEGISDQRLIFEAAAVDAEFAKVDAAEQPTYVANMRRHIRPIWFPAPAAENVARAERLILYGAQNGTLDFPAMIHAPIETWIIARLCKSRVTPNQITIFTAAVSAVVAMLFATGHVAAGTTLALVVGVLDGLDGKQARVKVETTPLGRREHVLDYVLELSWWTALAFHFASTGKTAIAYPLLLLLVGADLIGRVAKWQVKRKTGRNLDDVAAFDRFVRLIGARRNIYVWMLAAGLLLGATDQAFVAVCWWGGLTAAVHVARAIWISRHAAVARSESVPH